jgi:Zc3h12a-like Ribonuclease NYN domain
MVALVLLFLSSAAAVALSVAVPGWSDMVLLGGPMALASLGLLIWRWLRPVPPPAAPPRWVVVDGSNVLHWRDGVPDIATVREVVAHLTGLGFAPGVVFDANAGYKVSGRYQHDGALGRLLGLPEDRVMVVARGTPADPTVLAAARDLGGRIVTNDRFRDWAETHPEVKTPGHLIRGGYRNGVLWLDLDLPPAPRAATARSRADP